MLARSVRNPLVVGLGTGAVLIIAAAPPVLASTGTPTPSAAGSETASASPSAAPVPPPEKLTVDLSPTSKTVHTGTAVTFKAYLASKTSTAVESVELAISVDSDSVIHYNDCHMDGDFCVVGVVPESGTYVGFTVSVPAAGTATVDATAFVHTGNAYTQQGEAAPATITVRAAPTPKPTKSPSTKATHTTSSGSNSGSTGSSGTGTGSHTTPTGNLNSGVNGQAPSVAPSNNGAVLPGITGSNDPGQTPSTAPLVQNAGNSQSMEGASGPDELTFDKLASTQAAWLAALLVAFSLLLTQVRLGKANTRAARPVKPKGAHRRARRRTPGSRAL